MKALHAKAGATGAKPVAVQEVDSICPYCGVGCALT